MLRDYLFSSYRFRACSSSWWRFSWESSKISLGSLQRKTNFLHFFFEQEEKLFYVVTPLLLTPSIPHAFSMYNDPQSIFLCKIALLIRENNIETIKTQSEIENFCSLVFLIIKRFVKTVAFSKREKRIVYLSKIFQHSARKVIDCWLRHQKKLHQTTEKTLKSKTIIWWYT